MQQKNYREGNELTLKIPLLKAFDRVLGSFILNLLPSSFDKSSFNLRRVLLIRPGGIGDAVYLITAIRALKNIYPDLEVHVLAEKRNWEIFSLSPQISKIYLYDHCFNFYTAMRGRYDLVIDSEQWHRLSAIVAKIVVASLRIGYGTNNRGRLFHHLIPYSHEKHEVDSFLDLIAPLGVEKSQSTQEPFLDVPLDAIGRSGELLSGLDGTPFVVLFSGASIPERRWGVARFRALAESLQQQNVPVVVVGGRRDHQCGGAIVNGLPGLNLAGRTTLAETAAIIDRSALLVSGDSGVLHIAVGLGKPTVSLFGPGIAEKWAPRGPEHIVLNKNLPCSPCTKFGYTPRCPRNAECMSAIAVEEVTEAVFTLLERQKHKGRPEHLPEKEIV